MIAFTVTPSEARALKSRSRTIAIEGTDAGWMVKVSGRSVAGPFRKLGDAERFARGEGFVVVVSPLEPTEDAWARA